MRCRVASEAKAVGAPGQVEADFGSMGWIAAEEAMRTSNRSGPVTSTFAGASNCILRAFVPGNFSRNSGVAVSVQAGRAERSLLSLGAISSALSCSARYDVRSSESR